MVEPPNPSAAGPNSIATLVGTVLGERYEVGRVLGEGGMGAVFEGKDLRLGRAVAIKVMQPGYARDAEYAKRFLREAQTASKIRHRNVVVILDYGEATGGLVYSVMEFLVGQDLQQFLRGQPQERLPWAKACGLLIQITSGLKAAHGQGVIHRDIKPANCFLTTEDDEPVVKVVDFGIAKLEGGDRGHTLTGTAQVLGTPSYIAPELVRRQDPASPQSDIYALGVVAYRMLVGKLPFTADTVFEQLRKACFDPVPSLRAQVPGIPETVEALVLDMLAKDPQQRPPDMRTVRDRLVELSRQTFGTQAVELAGSSALPLSVVDSVPAPETTEDTTLPREPVGGTTERPQPGEVGITAVVLEPLPKVTAPARPRGAPRTVVVASPSIGAPREVVHDPVSSVPSGSVSGATVPAVGESTLRNLETSGSIERPRNTGWRVAGAVFVAAALGGVGWSMMQGGAEEPSPSQTPEPEVPSAEPERTVAPAAVAEPKREAVVTLGSELGTGEGPTGTEGIEELEPATEEVEPEVFEESIETETETEPDPPQPPKPPSGPPSDGRLTKKLGKKIRAMCATDIADQKVTVSFLVTSDGDPSLLTATPKNAAGECAKAQIVGTKFRARSGETPLKIVVE